MKRILLPTDGSEHALWASKYLADLYKEVPDVEVTVLHISPPVPPIYREEGHDPLFGEPARPFEAPWSTREEALARNQVFAEHSHD